MNPIEEKHSDIVQFKHADVEASVTRAGRASLHATITKETAVGFAEWVGEKGWFEILLNTGGTRWSNGVGVTYTTSELYDIYVESLKQ